MMGIRRSSTKKCSSYSAISGRESSFEPIDEVFFHLKLKILGRDLFQTLHNEFMFSYEIKGFLKKLNTPSTPKFVVTFIIEFVPLLDQIIVDVQRKNDVMVKLKLKQEVQPQEWVLAHESKGQVEELEDVFKYDDKDISSCYTDIVKWEKENKVMQSKEKRAKERRVELKNLSQEKIDVEDLIGLQHCDNVSL